MTYLKMKSENARIFFLFKILMVLVFVLVQYTAKADSTPNFSEGTELFVMAPSGLTLRSLPNSESKSLGIVPFGSRLIVGTQPDSISKQEKIEWVKGHWVKVEFEGVEGYMFDGYLSDLPLPVHMFEMSMENLDLIYPLESWAEVNFGVLKSDTIESKNVKKVVDVLGSGDRVIKTQYDGIYKMELIMENIRIMDAYHLLQSMIDHNNDLKTFIDQTTFIENDEGELTTVKVDINQPLTIRQMKGGNVKIILRDQNYICGL